MSFRVALAQINVTVGDFAANESRIAAAVRRAARAGADGIVFPELCVTGYPPEDLLFKPSFVRANLDLVERLVRLTKKVTAVFGYVEKDRKGSLYNGAAVGSLGKLRASYAKMHLPNYGVFDEKRYFTPGSRPLVLDAVAGKKTGGWTALRFGFSICEDIWVDHGPCQAEAASGAQVLINISASPYHAGKLRLRENLLVRRAKQTGAWIVYVNLVGGQDELVFDGGSMVVAPSGKIFFRAPQFEEGVFIVDLPVKAASQGSGAYAPRRIPWRGFSRRGVVPSKSAAPLGPEEEMFRALVLGLRDYVLKNGFSRVVVGMSGGIDSALTAAIAVAALGEKSVTAVSMPSRYSSVGTRSDAEKVSRALGVAFYEIPIEKVFQSWLDTLRPVFGNRPPDAAEENLQARIRGTLLMALANKFGWLVLSTGNKSEISTGYCTLYGDMVGGFAVIKDVPKTWVYRVSRYANRCFQRRVIPETVFRRAPSAELKPDQRDQDTLPPYDKLDRLITAYVEQNLPAPQVRRRSGLSGKEVERILRMIDVNEYKRRQAAPGIKITPRAFGRDRRMPLTNRFREPA